MSKKEAPAPVTTADAVFDILQACRKNGYVASKLVIPGYVDITLSLSPEEAIKNLPSIRAKLRATRDAELLGFPENG